MYINSQRKAQRSSFDRLSASLMTNYYYYINIIIINLSIMSKIKLNVDIN